MAKGSLRCLGPQLRLKQVYGSGFRLFFTTDDSRSTQNACSYVESLLPPGFSKIDNFATNIVYEFPAAPGAVARIFEEMEANKVKHGITDWGLSQTTLEEVFLRLISDEEAQAD
ncbi:hypothetical protein HK102_003684 [Quaeritorhiza haematococci]|nr:hypothetical protein HK102_003684 [Quaeritorhiza haematococci]